MNITNEADNIVFLLHYKTKEVLTTEQEIYCLPTVIFPVLANGLLH